MQRFDSICVEALHIRGLAGGMLAKHVQKQLAGFIAAPLAAGIAFAAAPLSAAALQESLASAEDVAFVVPFSRVDPVSCSGLPPLPRGATVEPLVDTRAHLILRRNAPRLTLDADGVPRILP